MQIHLKSVFCETSFSKTITLCNWLISSHSLTLFLYTTRCSVDFCTKSLNQKVRSAPFRKLQICILRDASTSATLGARGSLVAVLSTWLKCTWVKWKSTFSKNSLPSTRPKSLLHAGTNREILDFTVGYLSLLSIISASCCIYKKR